MLGKSSSHKQGFFNRRGPGAEVEVEHRDTHAQQKEKPAYPTMPGHLAAMQSAMTSAAKATESTTQTEKQETSSRIDAQSGSRLIVGPEVKLKGAEIEDCDTLVVEGRVEATMDSRVIQISTQGNYSGKVGVDVAEIYGKFDGELTARSQLIIHATGRVSGKIRYGKIFVEEGGILSGDIASEVESQSKASIPMTASSSIRSHR